MKKNLLKILFTIFTSLAFSQINLVKDISPGGSDGFSVNFSEIISYQNKILFAGRTPGGGLELFISDGTETGTFRIKDIFPGSQGSAPRNFFYRTLTDEVYFSASPSPLIDEELYKTDGTSSGTVLVNDFNTTTGSITSSSPKRFIEFDNRLFFNATNANNSTSYGSELTFTNGNSLHGFFDLNLYSPSPSNQDTQNSDPEFFVVLNNTLFFSAVINTSNSVTTARGKELCISDGTASGTFMRRDINPGAANGNPSFLTVFNNKVYFVANDGTNGAELWSADGSALGTQLVADINPGPNGSSIKNLFVFGNRLYFTADNGTSGEELFYMTTNENIILYRDINPGSASSEPRGFTSTNGILYFSADDGTNGRELWSANGGIFGIGLLKDINPGAGSSDPSYFTVYNNKIYFTATDGSNGIELYSSDGSNAGTNMIQNLSPGVGSSDPRALTVSDSKLFFHAENQSGNIGRELYVYIDPTLSVSNESVIDINLYPNPTTNSFKINSNEIIDSIVVYDITGKQVKEFKNTLKNYDISELVTGTYFIEIKSNDKVETLKLIKL